MSMSHSLCPSTPTLNGYIAMFQGKRLEIQTYTLYDAVAKATVAFKVPNSKRGLLAVMLAEKPLGTPVIHSTASI